MYVKEGLVDMVNEKKEDVFVEWIDKTIWEDVQPGKHVVGHPHNRLDGLCSRILLRHHL